MKFALRVIGTWMVVLALILLVVDGTKSLAVSAPVLTSVGALWAGLDVASWSSFQDMLSAHLSPYKALWLAESFFSVPAWALAAGIGVVALFFGRKRRPAVYADPL